MARKPASQAPVRAGLRPLPAAPPRRRSRRSRRASPAPSDHRRRSSAPAPTRARPVTGSSREYAVLRPLRRAARPQRGSLPHGLAAHGAPRVGLSHLPAGGAGRRIPAAGLSRRGRPSSRRRPPRCSVYNRAAPAGAALLTTKATSDVTTRLLDACLGRPVDATPVWLMRQAGRYLPEYRALREKLSFIELCRRPEVAVEITLQPLARFDLDAAIIFADILLPLEGMGIGFHFDAHDGPVIERTVRCAADLQGVRAGDPRADVPFVLDALRLASRELAGRVPLIGFAGAPFTLASYVIEGGHSRNYAEVKRLMLAEPATFARLMDLLADTVAAYLLAQVKPAPRCCSSSIRGPARCRRLDYERSWRPTAARSRRHARPRRAAHPLRRRRAPACSPRCRGRRRRRRRRLAHRPRPRPAELGDGVAVQGNLDPAALLGRPPRSSATPPTCCAGARAARSHLQSRSRRPAGDLARLGGPPGRVRPRVARRGLSGVASIDIAMLAFGGPGLGRRHRAASSRP